MSVALYGEALRTTPVLVRHEDGSCRPLDAHRWDGPLDLADEAVVRRLDGATIDVGCGPGRMVAAVAARGLPVLGIDIAPAAVERTRQRGVHVLQRNIFGTVPGLGRWSWALLVDGNVGIGGDPQRLLRRTRELLQSGGTVIVETGPPGSHSGRHRARLETDTAIGAWFDWATISADAIAAEAALSGLTCADVWSEGDRWFAELVRSSS